MELPAQRENQQLLNLPGPHGRLLQDGQFYGDKIKHMYGVDKLPEMPGEIWPSGKYLKYNNEKELMALKDQLSFTSDMGSLVVVKYLVSQGAGSPPPGRRTS